MCFFFFQLREEILSYPSCITTNVISKPVSSTRVLDGRVLGPISPPSTPVDLVQLERQRQSREQRSKDTLWTNVDREIDELLRDIQSKFHVNPSPEWA